MAKLNFTADKIASKDYVANELKNYYSKDDTQTIIDTVIDALPIYNGEVSST